VVSLDLLLKLLRARVPNVLAEHLKFFVTLDDLKLELSNLLL